MRQTTKIASIGMIIAIFSAAGCSTASGGKSLESKKEPSVSSFPAVENPKDLSFPLDKYRLLADNTGRRTVASATKILRTDCMKRFGFDFHDAETTAPLDFSHARLYGVADKRTASLYGYHNPNAISTPKKQASGLTPSAEAVLVGDVNQYKGIDVPKGGCAGDTARKLHRGSPGMSRESSQLPDRLIIDASQRSQTDSRVKKVFERWSTCMKESGYQYADPATVLRDPRFAQSGQPNQEEIATAQADVSCKKKYNVIGIWSAVESAYQRRLVEENQLILSKIESDISAQIKNASKVIGAEG
ncbi:hypothetical protein ACIBUY_28105 [Streptomyces sp. NPDC050085]|uniref:hypothetical protein n=1 Tax=Streptomyces sp. NPDC050085 TaxID=3365600 RepID=UPI0037AEE704